MERGSYAQGGGAGKGHTLTDESRSTPEKGVEKGSGKLKNKKKTETQEYLGQYAPSLGT